MLVHFFEDAENAFIQNKSEEYRENNVICESCGVSKNDIIKKGVYDGGVISPGVDLSIMNLKNSTALLPLFKLKKIQKNYGKNTYEALNAGFLWGYEGLINNIIKKISKNAKIKFKIILTGGYAKLFKRYLKKKSTIDENITINGIAKAFKELV